jgi:hypothetical protein
MKRREWIVALTVVIMNCFGCGSSDSGQAPADMHETLARLEEQRAAAAAANPASSGTSTAQTPAPAATPPPAAPQPSPAPPPAAPQPSPAPPPAPPQPATADPSLASKRGFDLEDWSNTAAYVLVKTDAATAAELLARELKGTVIKDTLGKPVNEGRAQAIVYQLAGHPWSIFACDNSQLETLAPALSRDADVLVFWQNDFNGWAGVELFRGGQQLEAVHWGVAEDGLGEDADPSKWDARGEFVRTYEDISMTDAFLFRSKLRQVTPAELSQGDAFIDAFMRHHDAYLPDADQMPWFDYDTKLINSPLGPAAFTAVHAVEVN